MKHGQGHTKYHSSDVIEQLMIMVQKMHKVKERACPYFPRHIVNVARPSNFFHLSYFNNPNYKENIGLTFYEEIQIVLMFYVYDSSIAFN